MCAVQSRQIQCENRSNLRHLSGRASASDGVTANVAANTFCNWFVWKYIACSCRCYDTVSDKIYGKSTRYHKFSRSRTTRYVTYRWALFEKSIFTGVRIQIEKLKIN